MLAQLVNSISQVKSVEVMLSLSLLFHHNSLRILSILQSHWLQEALVQLLLLAYLQC